MSILPCPHCGAKELVQHAWQQACLVCGKWSGERPVEPEVVTHGTTAPPVWDGNEDKGIVSALVTSLRRPVTRPGDPEDLNVEYPVILSSQDVPSPEHVSPPIAQETVPVSPPADPPTDPPAVEFPEGEPVKGMPNPPADPPAESA